MKVISPAAPFVSQILGRQKRVEGHPVRLAVHIIQCPVEDGVLFYHTLTCCLLLLSAEEAGHVTELPELIDNWFLVPSQHDDRKLCRQVRQAARMFQGTSGTVTDYTILPTTGCNARCFYCYEKGTAPVTMSPETADRLVRYILAHRGGEKVKIRWFGGEPLTNVPVIDRISSELERNGVPFSSTMFSNGYLFDAELAGRARDLWKLREVQITLDGTERTYNRVKRYVDGDADAFWRVLDNIGHLTASHIDVQVRLNVDKYNMEEMAQLVRLLHRRFGVNGHLSVYSRELYGRRSPEESAALYEQRMPLERLIDSCGYRVKRKLQNRIRLNCCMSDDDRGVLVAPSGHLGKCEHYIDRDFFGHIDSEDKDETVIRRFKELSPETEACATCPIYPQCIKLKVCEKHYCTPELQKELIRFTVDAMKDEYENYLNTQANES